MVQIIKDQAKGLPSDLSIINPKAVKLVLCYASQVTVYVIVTLEIVLGGSNFYVHFFYNHPRRENGF